jgi:predicted TIM-barrel fold metal-dependent hydrolase
MPQNVAKFEALPLSASTKQKILHDNAAALFPR